MTDECISPLRRRMIEDMTVRNFVVKTQTDYIRRVKSFAVFLGRSPDTATREDVRGYLLHLASSGMGAGTVNGTGSALRFLFDITLDRPEIVRHLPVAREPRKAPVILSPEEVARMLEAAPGVKYKAALSVAYGAGLRVSEVVALKVSDIDSARMMSRTEQSKRRKDRYASHLEPGGSRPHVGGGTWRQVQGGAERGLWGGSAGVRSRCAEGERYRQRADDDPDRAEQAPQGSLRNAVAAAARSAARLVGWFAARGAGCSRAAIHSSRSPRVSLPAPATRLRRRPGSRSTCLRIRCGTASPPISWSRMSMFA